MKRRNTEKRGESVAVAIDKDKGSQNAMRWVVDSLLKRGQTLNLIHVRAKPPSAPSFNASKLNRNEDEVKELFLSLRCLCSRKDINCEEAILEGADIAKTIIDYVQENAIETLVLGAPRGSLLRRFKATDVPSSVTKGAPSFCTVYVISRGKISSMRSSTSSPPPKPAIKSQPSSLSDSKPYSLPRDESKQKPMQRIPDEIEMKSPFNTMGYAYESSLADSDISFVSRGRPSIDPVFPPFCDDLDLGMPPELLLASEVEDNKSSLTGSYQSGKQSIDLGSCSSHPRLSLSSQESGRPSWSTQGRDELEAEMRRMKMELKQTMEMYSNACKEAIKAKKSATELNHLKEEKEQKLEEARLAKENAVAVAESEKAKYRAAVEAAAAAKKLAQLEAQKRKQTETRALKEAEEKKRWPSKFTQSDVRYRRYTLEDIEQATENFSESRKIGKGGYGTVYKGTLDHTPVAIKCLRTDAAQGRSQFQQEVEVLTCMRHPNMVLLLGACPEYGCLVYEYMANGSLEDRLFRRGNTPALPWQLRFRIAAEIATGLNFLHQTKPEPLVHRDLKPGNILIDRNFVSKIADVGLARLVPPSVADTMTQYRMTATAGTFYYIDPEYQQTGMLGTKSDIYSLGVMLLQIITGKPPMGLTHYVARAIEKGTLAEMLDPVVPDWPVEEALMFAKLALQCTELRRKDRPDLRKTILPELNRLRTISEASMPVITFGGGACPSSNSSRNNSQAESHV